jgi:hypothetical protein
VPAEAGQPEPVGPTVELALRFVPGQTATYRLTTEYYKSIEWKGSTAGRPAQFTDGRTGNHVEFTFEQRVQQVQDDGTAGLEITIKGLKYVTEAVNKTVFDFDSARPQDANRPLAALMGKSYRVKMSPQGQVVEIAGMEPVRQTAVGGLPDRSIADRLLADDEIHSRHEIAALLALKDRAARPGQTWSGLKTFSFDNLGAKTYERVYTLKDVGCAVHTDSNSGDERGKAAGGEGVHGTPYEGRQAVVEMKAIPAGAAGGAGGRPTVNPVAKLSDNSDSYEGRLVLDLDRGQVREDVEQMQNEWIIPDPASVAKGEPVAIRMAARRLHRLERLP